MPLVFVCAWLSAGARRFLDLDPGQSGGFLACEEAAVQAAKEDEEEEEEPSGAGGRTLGFLAAEEEEAPKLLGSGAELRFWPLLPSRLGGSEGPAASGSGSTSNELTDRGFLCRGQSGGERKE